MAGSDAPCLCTVCDLDYLSITVLELIVDLTRHACLHDSNFTIPHEAPLTGGITLDPALSTCHKPPAHTVTKSTHYTNVLQQQLFHTK